MTDLKDTKIGVGWRLEQELGKAKLPRFPCLKCGRETKSHHPCNVVDKKTQQVRQFQTRICSYKPCRQVLVLVPRLDYAEGIRKAKRRILDGMQRRTGDGAAAVDTASVALDTTVRPPVHPCSVCGSETKGHHPVLTSDGVISAKTRICARPSCRAIETVSLN